jgi:hypothetical protein
MITVTICHNVAHDGEGHHTAMLDGYRPGDPMVRVFAYQADPAGRRPEGDRGRGIRHLQRPGCPGLEQRSCCPQTNASSRSARLRLSSSVGSSVATMATSRASASGRASEISPRQSVRTSASPPPIRTRYSLSRSRRSGTGRRRLSRRRSGWASSAWPTSSCRCRGVREPFKELVECFLPVIDGGRYVPAGGRVRRPQAAPVPAASAPGHRGDMQLTQRIKGTAFWRYRSSSSGRDRLRCPGWMPTTGQAVPGPGQSSPCHRRTGLPLPGPGA